VITSTGSPHFIFKREHGEKLMALRKNKPMFFIDIAVPRDVDPEMNKIDGLFVYDIDDLQQAVSSHVADRKKEAERRRRSSMARSTNSTFACRRWMLSRRSSVCRSTSKPSARPRLIAFAAASVR
jgi:glutamyl-tRNA reductase